MHQINKVCGIHTYLEFGPIHFDMALIKIDFLRNQS